MNLSIDSDIKKSNLVFLIGFQSICKKNPLLAKTIFQVSEEVLQLFVNASHDDLMKLAETTTHACWTLRRADNGVLWDMIFDDLMQSSDAQQTHLELALMHTISAKQQAAASLRSSA